MRFDNAPAEKERDLMDALLALRELQEADGLIPKTEMARRAREILDRADLKPIDLVLYLAKRGYHRARLARAAGTFGAAVSEAYVAAHGVRPLKVEVFVEHLQDTRMVNGYLEADRPLLDAVFVSREVWA